MHLVLQQEWINGKSYLVEKGELDTLLDILNLSSDVLEKEGEADMVSETREPEEVLAWEEGTSPVDADEQGLFERDAMLAEEEDTEQLIEKAEADEITDEITSEPEELSGTGEQEDLQREDEQVLASEPEQEQDVVVAWYYWPNGTMLKG